MPTHACVNRPQWVNQVDPYNAETRIFSTKSQYSGCCCPSSIQPWCWLYRKIGTDLPRETVYSTCTIPMLRNGESVDSSTFFHKKRIYTPRLNVEQINLLIPGPYNIIIGLLSFYLCKTQWKRVAVYNTCFVFHYCWSILTSNWFI